MGSSRRRRIRVLLPGGPRHRLVAGRRHPSQPGRAPPARRPMPVSQHHRDGASGWAPASSIGPWSTLSRAWGWSAPGRLARRGGGQRTGRAGPRWTAPAHPPWSQGARTNPPRLALVRERSPTSIGSGGSSWRVPPPGGDEAQVREGRPRRPHRTARSPLRAPLRPGRWPLRARSRWGATPTGPGADPGRAVAGHPAETRAQGRSSRRPPLGHTGRRFSRKAARPSAASWVEAATLSSGCRAARASAAAMSQVA